ncbi:uncharacterized protein FRV6_02155 [Fusarium oxysporum]|uniref:Uncharacterized protein n=1 Tax=Fusarium oxysporum TaxID=5507 RepID=A0A2H3T891_FUSOX|nr:uncharacterized protein FRV6_02155 [Fusarium oxysporum]
MDYHNPAEKLPKLHSHDRLQVPSLSKLALATDARARLGHAVCYFEERIQKLEPKGPEPKIQNISRHTGGCRG